MVVFKLYSYLHQGHCRIYLFIHFYGHESFKFQHIFILQNIVTCVVHSILAPLWS